MLNGVNIDPAGASAFDDDLDSYCVCGDFTSSNKESLKQHMASAAHRRNYIEHPERVFQYSVRLEKSAFKNHICEYIVDLNKSTAQSPAEVLGECKETIRELYNFELATKGSMKVQLRLSAIHENAVNLCKLPENEEPEPYNIIDHREVQPKFSVCMAGGDFEKFFDEQLESIVEKFENMTMKGSGWTFESFSHLTMCIAELDAVRGSSYIREPVDIMHRRATVNIRNYYDEL